MGGRRTAQPATARRTNGSDTYRRHPKSFCSLYRAGCRTVDVAPRRSPGEADAERDECRPPRSSGTEGVTRPPRREPCPPEPARPALPGHADHDAARRDCSPAAVVHAPSKEISHCRAAFSRSSAATVATGTPSCRGPGPRHGCPPTTSSGGRHSPGIRSPTSTICGTAERSTLRGPTATGTEASARATTFCTHDAPPEHLPGGRRTRPESPRNSPHDRLRGNTTPPPAHEPC